MTCFVWLSEQLSSKWQSAAVTVDSRWWWISGRQNPEWENCTKEDQVPG